MVEAELVATRNPVFRQQNLRLTKKLDVLMEKYRQISKLLENARNKSGQLHGKKYPWNF
jgi:hypothetical protein